jgi:hypothetical protein
LDRGATAVTRDAQGHAQLASAVPVSSAAGAGASGGDGKEAKESKRGGGSGGGGGVADMQLGDDESDGGSGSGESKNGQLGLLERNGISGAQLKQWERLATKLHRVQSALLYKELYVQVSEHLPSCYALLLRSDTFCPF